MPVHLLTLAEAAADLGLAASTLRWQVHNGKLRAQLVGKTWVITPRELERYRREHQRDRDGSEPQAT